MRIKLKVDGYEYDVPPPVGDILVKHGLAETDRLWKTTYEAAMEGLVAGRGDADAHPFARTIAAKAASVKPPPSPGAVKLVALWQSVHSLSPGV